jgi:hypothetical protein
MPRYTHDCDACEYLGEHLEYDLYYCPRCDGGTVLARYGNDGPDYASTMVSLLTKEHVAFYNANPSFLAGQALIKALELQKARAA